MDKKISKLLNEKINEVFVVMQNDLGIDSGDIEPFDLLRLNELQDELAKHIEKILRYELD